MCDNVYTVNKLCEHLIDGQRLYIMCIVHTVKLSFLRQKFPLDYSLITILKSVDPA